MAYVYRHIRLDKNEPFYIGIGKKPNYARATQTHGRNKIWKAIVAKTAYEIEILFDDITWEEANDKEMEFIALYGKICNQTGILANLTDGGDGKKGVPHAEETKALMSRKMKGNLNGLGHKKSEEELKRMSERMKGKRMSEESIKKMAQTKRGKKQSPEAIAKRTEAIRKTREAKGPQKRTPEQCERMRLAQQNRKPTSEAYKQKLRDHWAKIGGGPMSGKKASPETKLKQSIAQRKRFGTYHE